MVTRHAKTLAERMPSVRDKRVSPHTIRHTTATHLLQNKTAYGSIVRMRQYN
ncbi:hypothetical protein [Prevotella sp. ne3005]|uniref:hypothetical protein n=1 Tax=Prevotella sp. ne3005 TaxID=1761887 RepID=UPI00147CB2BA|nr:hypothetical protein [Prevotella sp. ne3005]